jgi:hypothetical protein
MSATTFPTFPAFPTFADLPAVPDAAELFRRGESAARTVADAYATAVEATIEALPAIPSADALPATLPTAGEAAAAVDSVYDYATKAVAISREFAKSIASIATV